MLNYEETNEYYYDYGVPTIELEDKLLGENLYLRDNIVKFIREDYLDETIILIKYIFTSSEFEIGTNTHLPKDFSMDIYTPIYLKQNKNYIRDKRENLERIYPVRKLRTRNSNGSNSDYIIIFSTNNKCNDDRVNRIIEREEKEQLNNTIFKLNIKNSGNYTEKQLKEYMDKWLDNQERKYPR